MPLKFNGTEIKKVIYNGTEIKNMYYGSTKVFTTEVTWKKYNVNTSLSIVEGETFTNSDYNNLELFHAGGGPSGSSVGYYSYGTSYTKYDSTSVLWNEVKLESPTSESANKAIGNYVALYYHNSTNIYSQTQQPATYYNSNRKYVIDIGETFLKVLEYSYKTISSSSGSFTYYYVSKGTKCTLQNVNSIGSYIGTVTADAGTYPDNGIKDGYWYVKQ